MAKYLSLSECLHEVEFLYTINNREKKLFSTRPLLVKTSTITPTPIIYIDRSGSMSDIEQDILYGISDSLIDPQTIFPGDERWINWIYLSLHPEKETLALIFIDESSPYLNEDYWRRDLVNLLSTWTSTPKSYAHVFIINDEGEYSSLLISQVSSAFSLLKETGYSYSIISASTIAQLVRPGEQGTMTNPLNRNPPEKTKIKSPLSSILRKFAKGYLIEIFACPLYNLDVMIQMFSSSQEIPDWMFLPIITAKSSTEIEVKFNCGEGCSISAFEIPSRWPPGWECFPYSEAIEGTRKINDFLAKIIDTWRF